MHVCSCGECVHVGPVVSCTGWVFWTAAHTHTQHFNAKRKNNQGARDEPSSGRRSEQREEDDDKDTDRDREQRGAVTYP